MNPEADQTKASSSPEKANTSSITLDSLEVKAMRHCLHELANVFTGVMIAGDLLSQHLETESLLAYALRIREGSERGCALVRELRSQLLVACGELEADNSVTGNSTNSIQGPNDPIS